MTLRPDRADHLGAAYVESNQAVAASDLQGLNAAPVSVVDGMAIATALVIQEQALPLLFRTIVFSG